MRGSVRKRGSTWEYRLELGLQPKQRCRKCREEYWPDGRPLAACPCGGQLEDVQRRRERTRGGFRTKKLAQEALDKAKVAVQEGEYVEPSKLTVADYLVRMWLPSIKASLRPSTYQSYRMQIETYILPRLGSIWLQKLGPEAIGALYADLLDDGKVHRAKPVPKASGGEIATTSEPVKRGLSPVSVRHTHAVGRRAFRDAVKRQYLKRNPFDAVDQPKAVTVHEMKFWNAEQVRTFLAATRGERLNPLWRLLVDRGLRRGEACGLRWEDVDFETSRLSIRRALIPLGREVHICEPKTKKGRRVLPLNAATVAALRSQAACQADDAQQWGAAWNDSGYVFTQEDGQPLHPTRVSKAFADVQKKAPVPRIRLHDLRHTCAVLHLKAGVHIKVVQELLGHATIAITMDTYSHVLPGMQEEAAERIAALLDPAL